MLPLPSSRGRRRSPCDAPLATKVVQGEIASIWLPQDIIAEILSRLPLKSLCRFRCVSRGWRALISGPAFVSEHRNRTAAEPLILASCLPESCSRLFDLQGNLVRVIRGVGSFTKSISSREDHLACLVQALYEATVIDLATGEVLVACAGGPALAFGRAVPSGLYKLLYFRYGKCVILTVGDDAAAGWRKKVMPSTIIAHYSDTITINGMAYLFVQERVNVIVRFDLESEEWRKGIRAPPSKPKEPRIKVRLGELGGSLCVGTTDTDKTHDALWEIWRLDDPANTIWVKAYSIASRYSELMPIKVLPDGKKLFFYGQRGGPRLQIYDPDDGTCTDVAKMPMDHTWTISLCSLHLEHFVGGQCIADPSS